MARRRRNGARRWQPRGAFGIGQRVYNRRVVHNTGYVKDYTYYADGTTAREYDYLVHWVTGSQAGRTDWIRAALLGRAPDTRRVRNPVKGPPPLHWRKRKDGWHASGLHIRYHLVGDKSGAIVWGFIDGRKTLLNQASSITAGKRWGQKFERSWREEQAAEQGMRARGRGYRRNPMVDLTDRELRAALDMVDRVVDDLEADAGDPFYLSADERGMLEVGPSLRAKLVKAGRRKNPRRRW